MYEHYYGLKEKPFNLTPDPDYLFMSHEHEETYTHLEYAIAENKGFVVITGEIGSGKTTLINLLLKKLHNKVNIALINQTLIRPKQFIKRICQEFELTVNNLDKSEMIDLFHSYLLKQFAKKNRTVLIIDEAQNLPDETLEEIRMLSNLEAEKHHILQIVLLGQPELKHKLQRKNLQQFNQRVTVSWHLNGMDQDETRLYILHRLKISGAENSEIFNTNAIQSIYSYSRGIPRLINILCDAALVHGYADDLKIIDNTVIDEVVNVRNLGWMSTDTANESDTEKISSADKRSIKRLNERIQDLENKIALLESSMANITSMLESFSTIRENRDKLVLELTTMLKQSMESQVNLMQEIVDLKHSTENDKSQIRTISKPGQG